MGVLGFRVQGLGFKFCLDCQEIYWGPYEEEFKDFTFSKYQMFLLAWRYVGVSKSHGIGYRIPRIKLNLIMVLV